MNKFNKVLDVEKQYKNIVEEAQTNYDKELEKFKNKLNKTEVSKKNEIKIHLDKELNSKKEALENEGSKLVEEAKKKARNIELSINKNEPTEYLFNQFKEVNL